jgi:Tat protein translocase TatB subunit
MPEIGPMELLVVAVVALLVFGPEKLPEMARNVGRTISDLRRTAQEMRDEFSTGLDDDTEPPPRRTRPSPTEDPDDDADYVVEDEPPGTRPRPPGEARVSEEDDYHPPEDPEVDPAGEGPAPPGGEYPDEDTKA